MVNTYMFENAKAIISGIVLLVVISLVGGSLWYYNWSKNQIEMLKNNNAILDTAVKTNEKTIKSLQVDMVRNQTVLKELDTRFQDSRTQNEVLRSKLSEHDLGYLAAMKPGLIQKRVNAGTTDAGRCFEIVSGAPLTDKEKAATLKSEINTICPDIANPSYKVKP